MISLSRAPGVLLLVCVALGGCSSIEPRFTAIEARQAALEAQIADLQTAQQNIVARLVQLRGELDNSLQPMRTQSADRGEDLRMMGRDLTALEEEYGELDARISRLTEQLAAGQGVPGAAPQPGTAMPAPRGARVPSGTRQTTPPTPPQDNQAQQLYNSAFNDYLRENHDLCVQGFQEYIRRYAMSDRADDAQYWIGQCHLSAGQEQAARDAFTTLIRNYPNSDLIPDAMLNDALILEQQGRGPASIEAFRRLIQAYARSDAAFLACNELDKLGADRPAACEEMQQ